MEPTRHPSDIDPNPTMDLNSIQEAPVPNESDFKASGNTFDKAAKINNNIEVPSDPQGTGVLPEATTVERTNDVANEALQPENAGEDTAAPSLFATVFTHLPTVQDAISGGMTAVSSLFLYKLLDKKTYNFDKEPAIVNLQKQGVKETSLRPQLLPLGLKVVKFVVATIIGTTLQTIAISKLFSDSLSFMPASNRTYGKNFLFTAVLFLMQEGWVYSKLAKGHPYFPIKKEN